MRACIYCNKELRGRKTKFCSEICSYRYKSIQNHKPGNTNKSQQLRMNRAARRQRKSDVRYN